MIELLEKAAAYMRGQEEKKTQSFDELVALLASGKGKAPTPAALAEALKELSKTPEDLQEALEHRLQRHQYAATLATLPQLQADKAELERKATKENLRHEAIVKPLEEAHRQTIDGLNARYGDVLRQIPVAESMKDKLRETYRGPLTEELAEIRAKQGELNRAIVTAEQNAQTHERAADVTGFARDYAGTMASDAHVPAATEAAKACRETAANRRKELAPLTEREAEILEAMLLP